MAEDFNPGDRVVRKGTTGPKGTVQKIREERIRESLKERQAGQEKPGIAITVLWDNGTASHFIPEALEQSN